MCNEPCCPHCGETENFETTAAVIDGHIVMESDGWSIDEPGFDMDVAYPTQPITCRTCGYEGTAQEFGFIPENTTKRPIDMKTLSVHGNVSLLYCVALRFNVPDDVKLMFPYRQAGYEPHQLVLITLEPTHGMRAFHNAFDADTFDHDLGDAYTWLEKHFNEIPDDGFLLDLPYARGTAHTPTTTFEKEYLTPMC